MTIPAIDREILIDAPATVVWSLITEPEGLAQWFAESAELDLRPGGRGTLTFPEHGSADLTVQTVEPPHRFSFLWVAPESQPDRGTNRVLVEFTLTPQDGGTHLRVTETGLEGTDLTPEQQAAYARDHLEGWTHFLGVLRQKAADGARPQAGAPASR